MNRQLRLHRGAAPQRLKRRARRRPIAIADVDNARCWQRRVELDRASEDDSDRGDTTHMRPHHPGANRHSGVHEFELEIHLRARQKTSATLDESTAARQVEHSHDDSRPNASSHHVARGSEADTSKLSSFRSLGHGADHCPVAL